MRFRCDECGRHIEEGEPLREEYGPETVWRDGREYKVVKHYHSHCREKRWGDQLKLRSL